MLSWVTLKHLADWTKGTLVSGGESLPVKRLNSDTRSIQPGDIFVALKGEQFDGHDYILQAVEAGAVAVIAERSPQIKVPHLKVDATLEALIRIGSRLRREFPGPVIAITGSAGKSSTKDMTAALLGPGTLKSPKSYNNLLGVSQTLCLIEDSTKFVVLEMGMNAEGELKAICEAFHPVGGTITNVGDAHIGRLGGREGIFRAKKEVFDYLSHLDGDCLGVVINLDDPYVVRAAKESFGAAVKRVTYSIEGKEADISIESIRVHPVSGHLSLTIRSGAEEIPVTIPHFGLHHAANLAASVGLARLVGISWKQIRERLPSVVPSLHRGVMTDLGDGKTLIDESYNSNPSALWSSLCSVNLLDPARRRVLVVGAMRELEGHSADLHREVGEKIGKVLKKNGVQAWVIGVGEDTKAFLAGLAAEAPTIRADFAADVATVTPLVSAGLKPGDLVFVKGSRGIQLDLLVKSLTSAPKK